ncbi:hypothetical protein EIP91_009645 [Steccherinum ochraceum]|uniref:Uncharacterized protein n=1 Tax=Steccherinum ochraceum TaxID=92696 RepID=A0A4R0RAT2_9APHY|nr:hypothetical protein EIP91_009645 [Steccherinum ochraceum]
MSQRTLCFVGLTVVVGIRKVWRLFIVPSPLGLAANGNLGVELSLTPLWVTCRRRNPGPECEALGCDFASALSEEYVMLFTHKIGPYDVAYVISRLLTLFLLTSITVYGLAPIHNCHVIAHVQGWAAAFQTPSSSLLFFIRVRAVFRRNTPVVVFFGIFWLAILGTSILAPFQLTSVPLGSTGFCHNNRLGAIGILGVLLSGVYDTLVFLTITTTLLKRHFLTTRESWVKAFFTGDGLGQVTRLMLQTGQTYYLATAGFTVTTLVMILAPSVPDAYSDVFIPLNAFVTNVMAARVYRRLKLELIGKSSSSQTSAGESRNPTLVRPGILALALIPPEMNVSNPEPLPNPYTELAWLPPDVALQVQNVEFILCGLTGALVCDLLWSLPEEYKMLSRRRMGPYDVVYVLSRLLTAFFVTSISIFSLAPYNNCDRQALVQGWAAAWSTPMTSLLFFIRIRAVFPKNIVVVGFFAVTWLAILGTSLLAPFEVKAVPMGASGFCVNERLEILGILAIIVAGVYDTLVFLAITVSLLKLHWGAKVWTRGFFTGEGMGTVTRLMLQTGQTYYLCVDISSAVNEP